MLRSLRNFALWSAGAIIAFAISHSAGSYLILGVYLAVTLIAYILDCLRAPMRKCWRCGGTGDRHSWFRKDATGKCPACIGRNGRQPRLATLVFRLPRH